MPRSVEGTPVVQPSAPDTKAWRHFGDGTAGELIASRIQGYDSSSLAYVDVAVDSTGQLKTTASAGGGGAATVADGADVTQGAIADAAYTSGSGTVVAILKGIYGKLAGTLSTSVSNFPATQAVSGTVAVSSAPTTAVTGPVTDTQLRASAVPVSLATAPTTPVTGPLTDTQLRAAAVPVSSTTLALDATLTGGTQKTKLVDTAGTNALSVSAAGAAKVDGSAVTQPVSIATMPSTPVTGTFFQATQPVSIATNTPDVTDRAARLLGHVTVDSAPSTAVTNAGTFAVQAAATLAAETTKVIGTVNVAAAQTIAVTQAAAANLNATVAQGTAAAVGTAWPIKVSDGTNVAAVKAASVVALTTDPAQVVQQAPQRADASNLCVTNTAATGVACTLTIPAAGAGLFHYISLIEIQLYATAARTGGATPILVTTTNLPGSPVWDFDTAQAIGVTIRQTTQPTTPIKSSVANTATTIVAPIATTGIWRITAYYYAAV